MVNQVAEGAGERQVIAATGDRSPELDGSVPQKLVEMQDHENHESRGPNGLNATENQESSSLAAACF